MAKPIKHESKIADSSKRACLQQVAIPIKQQLLTTSAPPSIADNPFALLAKPSSKYVTDATIASLIESSRSTIWRYVKDGILPPPIKIGRLTRFDLGHALACIRAGTIVPAPTDRT
ncbi:MAG: hypothetical protein K9G71_19650 [Rhodobacteraceae bacterium]|nr:hypothetical protein [Paracoccaceae bacterium]MCF8516570.1 hypothetical protein [Paracoccaceae bacterium]MCF8520919.1 hypothetical protein [Paracoccaceae bacterium]